MLDASLSHMGLSIDMSHPDQPLKQIGPGVNAKTFGVYDPVLDDVPEENIMTSRDMYFVKECIHASDGPLEGDLWFQGREKDKVSLLHAREERSNDLQ